MSDYTLLEAALELGGRVATVNGSDQGVPLAVGSLAEPVPLSTAHISPFVEYRDGASLLRTSKGGYETKQVGGGRRGCVMGFSKGSRRRLMQTIAGVRRDAKLPLFVTLTYPETFPEPKQAKRHIDTFFKRLKRAYPEAGLIWKLEPQERGAPHFHLLVWGVNLADLRSWVPGAWFEIAGGGDQRHLHFHQGDYGNEHCVNQVKSWKGVWSYASKYLGKTFEVAGWNELWTGRYWGIINRDAIPFGELVQVEVTKKKVLEVMRYQRRFAGLKHIPQKSLSIFCDADQWIEKIGLSASW